ncbi:type II toxin-antitoxin system HicA family toxin [Candidatus Chloroploca sp. M-50]|uniref:Type II toxin-antitoxin system HicA family toxin n=1 Tax=Candidatus Chloroploca mongolica TaxID=2528176 RepID=A0ABS4DBC5_9CHLR|nr:type II toxin-antitoxin system HicA family toxin [Candidatus Chloroploca mongolica]MBP1466752.1 type II toxin-antitoxin system HicA family toxin [Candidatus Chloroploca mongolica]NCC32198.1 type II toxin-antitoxin system HicA family toxin [Chloroflexia bacterium]
MPPFGPISRVRLIRGLRALGFQGPYPAGRHAFMVREEKRITIPNPHRGDIGVGLLATILRQADVSREEWEQV